MNINILININGKTEKAFIVCGSLQNVGKYTWLNRPWQNYSGQNAILDAIDGLIKVLEDTGRKKILKEQNRKRWTTSLSEYLQEYLEEVEEYKELKKLKADLEGCGNKYEEYIKNNIINYIYNF